MSAESADSPRAELDAAMRAWEAAKAEAEAARAKEDDLRHALTAATEAREASEEREHACAEAVIDILNAMASRVRASAPKAEPQPDDENEPLDLRGGTHATMADRVLALLHFDRAIPVGRIAKIIYGSEEIANCKRVYAQIAYLRKTKRLAHVGDDEGNWAPLADAQHALVITPKKGQQIIGPVSPCYVVIEPE